MFRLLGMLLVLVFAVACGSPTATDSSTAATPSEPTTAATRSPGTGDGTPPSPGLTPAPSQPVTTGPPSPEPPSPPPSPPPSSISPPPTAKPPESGLIRVKGEIREGVEAGCTVLHTPGGTYQVVAPKSMDLPRHREVTVLGQLRPEMMSYCQQGAILEVKQVWTMDRPRG